MMEDILAARVKELAEENEKLMAQVITYENMLRNTINNMGVSIVNNNHNPADVEVLKVAREALKQVMSHVSKAKCMSETYRILYTPYVPIGEIKKWEETIAAIDKVLR